MSFLFVKYPKITVIKLIILNYPKVSHILDFLFPIIPNRLFLARTKNNRHFRFPEMKITDFKFSGTHLGTNFNHCRFILKTDKVPGTKSRLHYLCLESEL